MDRGIDDPEKKTKKEKKAREKELKRKKALDKAAKLQAQQANSSRKREQRNVKRSNQEDNNAKDFVDPETPYGEKKRLSTQMAKQYNPSAVEKSWYEWWEKTGYFMADDKSSKPPFVTVLPPPNVNGVLHIGHALTASLEDTIIRWRRMSGFNTLWVPGMAHAGISTQVVEKKLMHECQSTKHDIDDKNSMSEIWNWKNKYGVTILQQLRSLGSSLDWSREYFTMDEKRSKAVTEAFVRLHKKELIHRDNSLVNWDCFLQTEISDAEVDYIDINERKLLNIPGYEKPVEFGVMTSFAYPLEDDLENIVVATTRVETMLGDTAIAVHPDDPRYQHIHGKHAIHPFNGRRIRIIPDASVNQLLGTGAVKITPAHDHNDFNIGKCHNLEFINIFTDDGKIYQDGGGFAGMLRFEAREAVTEALKKKGLLREANNYEIRLAICRRSKDVVEAMMKPQWYIDCSSMAKEALDAVMDDKNTKLEIIPRQYISDWKRRLENIHDWCISRQRWWGHCIPAWYAVFEGDKPEDFGAVDSRWMVARNEEDAQALAGQTLEGKKYQLIQDPHMLDSWFSSALVPLSALGWPDDTEDLSVFFPTSMLQTGNDDTLFFWVARMVMLGITLAGDVPFTKVYLHPIIHDVYWRNMAKCVGNAIDPVDVINGISTEALQKKLIEGNLDLQESTVAMEGQVKAFPNGIAKCGADALRFALVSYTAQSVRINLDIQRVVGFSRWCNKLWNAVRFAINQLGDDYAPPSNEISDLFPFSCKWILSLLNDTISKTVSSLELYKFSDAATAVYAWWQYQFCDVFIEVIKLYFSGNNPKFVSERRYARDTLWLCLDQGLRILHPFMPFVTEELWQRLPSSGDLKRAASIMIYEYPSKIQCWTNERVKSEMNLLMTVVKSFRSLAKESRRRLPAFVHCQTDIHRQLISSHQLVIETLANLSSLTVINEINAAITGCMVFVLNEKLAVGLDLSVYELHGSFSADTDLEKIWKKMEAVKLQREKLLKAVRVAGYIQKAPKKIQKADTDRLELLEKEEVFLELTSQRMESHISKLCAQKLYYEQSSVVKNYFQIESDFMVTRDYTETEKNMELRKRVIDQCRIAARSKLPYFDGFIPYFTINIFDRFTSRLVSEGRLLEQVSDIDNVFLACLILAWKMRTQRFSFELFKVSEYWRSLQVMENIIDVEFNILNTLEWRMIPVTPFCFVDYYGQYSGMNSHSRVKVCKIILKTQEELYFLSLKPSVIAAAAVFLCARFDCCALKNKLKCKHVNMDDVWRCMVKINEIFSEIKVLLESD